MRVAGTEYNLKYMALEIYLSGCKGHPCEGCHNEALWDATVGEPYEEFLSSERIDDLLRNPLVGYVWILGGEPLDNDVEDLKKLALFFKKKGKGVWLWTRHELDEVPPDLMMYLDFIKTGMYRKDLGGYTESVYDIHLASTNQKVHDVRATKRRNEDGTC